MLNGVIGLELELDVLEETKGSRKKVTFDPKL